MPETKASPNVGSRSPGLSFYYTGSPDSATSSSSSISSRSIRSIASLSPSPLTSTPGISPSSMGSIGSYSPSPVSSTTSPSPGGPGSPVGAAAVASIIISDDSSPSTTLDTSEPAYLLHVAAAQFCQDRPVNATEQARLESLVFSKSFDADRLSQPAPHFIQLYDYDLYTDTILGSGSYGNVYLFENITTSVYLAVKFSDIDNEDEISKALLKAGCRVLRVRPVGKQLMDPTEGKLRYTYLMELAEGTLPKFLNTLFRERKKLALSFTPQDFITIFLNIGEELRHQMLCLYDLNPKFVYTDLKATNVLFKCESRVRSDTVRFFLGDLGSAVPSDDDDHDRYISTFPPPEFRSGKGHMRLLSPFAKEAAMAWELGVLLLYLVAHNRPEFRYLEFDRITSVTDEIYHQLYRMMVLSYGEDIALLLHSNPLKRRNIRLSLV